MTESESGRCDRSNFRAVPRLGLGSLDFFSGGITAAIAAAARTPRAFKPEEISECLIYRLRGIGRRRRQCARSSGTIARAPLPLSFCALSARHSMRARARARLLFSNLNRLRNGAFRARRDRRVRRIRIGPRRWTVFVIILFVSSASTQKREREAGGPIRCTQ